MKLLRLGFLFILPLAAALRGISSEVPKVRAILPDARQAEVNGKVAVGFWPAQDGELLDPDRFSVHLVDDASLEEELVLPAGHWLLPPPGAYKTWIEGDGLLSPSFGLLRYSGNPFRGRGIASITEVEPAGRVSLVSKAHLSSEISLRILHLGRPEQERKDRGFMRALRIDSPGQSVLFPRGPAVALLYESESRRYFASTRPFTVEVGKITNVRPKKPSATDLFAILKRAKPRGSDHVADVALQLSETDGDQRPPDAIAYTWEWIYALWYEVDGATARVQGASESEYLKPEIVRLEPGSIVTLRRDLVAQPSLPQG